MRSQCLVPVLLGLASLIDGTIAHKGRLRFNQWSSADCGGSGDHPRKDDKHLKMGKCKDINARSVLFHISRKNNRNKWLSDVANQQKNCYVTLFESKHCDGHTGATQHHNVPDAIDPHEPGQCFSLPKGIRSMKFWCHPRKVEYPTTYLDASESAGYTINKASDAPVLTTATVEYNVTSTVTADVDPTNTEVAEGTENLVNNRYSRRNLAMGQHHHHLIGNFWYKVPVGGKPMCFECKGKKMRLRDYNIKDHFKCKSKDRDPKHCEPLAPHVTTVYEQPPQYTVYQDVVTIPAPSESAQKLAERRDHQKVRMRHPGVPNGDPICAKFTWKHEGSKKSEFKLSGPKKCKGDEMQLDVVQGTVTHTSALPPSTTTHFNVKSDMSLVPEVETVTMPMGV